MHKVNLKKTISNCMPSLKLLLNDSVKGIPMGLEKMLQDAVFRRLGSRARKEVPLADVGARPTGDRKNGKMDIVLDGNHGIELKVVRLPRLRGGELYDVGQLSSDYWRLADAKNNLKSGELLVLMFGSLVESLPSPYAIRREFHNRMYLDFQTSRDHGELKTQSRRKDRMRQIEAVERMGFDKPCKGRGCKCSKFPIFVHDQFALISVPISRTKWAD